MYTEEEFTRVEQEERELTDEAIAAMLLILATTKGNIKNELRRFYQEYGKDGVVTYAEARKWINNKERQRRLTALSLYISGEFFQSLGKLKSEFEKMLKSVIGKETGFFDVEVDIDKILTRKWGTDNKTWLQRLEEDVDLWTVKLNSDIKLSILRRKRLDDVLKDLDGRFESINAVATKLGLTESTAIGSLARKKIFEELGIKKYRFYTKPDERRCEQCGSLHGLVFPISAYEVGVTASPIHPMCRCWEVPILE